MKKLLAIVLAAAVLFGAATVLADIDLITRSKTTEDLTKFEVEVEHPVEGRIVEILPINEHTVGDISKYQVNLDVAEEELKKALKAGTVETYFDPDAAVDIEEIFVDIKAVYLDEMFAIIQVGYEEGMGEATVKAQLPTPYDKDEKVAAMIGILKDGVLTWHVFEGIGLEDNGILFVADEATMLEINPNIALFAVCSR